MIAQRTDSFQTGRFEALSCPCELLVDNADPSLLQSCLDLAQTEAARIEKKFSRFLKGNVVDEINHAQGSKIKVDDETAALLDFAAEGYAMSEGLFDITTGALRKKSDAGGIGWNHVTWKRPFLEMPAGFEIDFGGIGKEYAADRILSLLRSHAKVAALVNLGGDIAAAGERLWSVGIEDPREPGRMAHTVYLRQGGIATSGTTKRPGHIVNPRTRHPVEGAPLSVTVAAKTCTEAGFWSTLALLQGEQAESFLKKQSLEFWSCRSPSRHSPRSLAGNP